MKHELAALVATAVCNAVNVILALALARSWYKHGLPVDVLGIKRMRLPSLPSSPSHSRVMDVYAAKFDSKENVIFAHHLMTLATILLSVASSVDPLGIRGIVHFGVWYLLIVIIQGIGFGFVLYWSLCWVKFLAEYLRLTSSYTMHFIKIALVVGVGINFALGISEAVLILMNRQEECKFVLEVYIIYWLVTLCLFLLVITVLTVKIVRFLVKKFAKNHKDEVSRIFKRSLLIGAMSFFLITLIGVVAATDPAQNYCEASDHYHGIMVYIAASISSLGLVYLILVYILEKENLELQKFALERSRVDTVPKIHPYPSEPGSIHRKTQEDAVLPPEAASV